MSTIEKSTPVTRFLKMSYRVKFFLLLGLVSLFRLWFSTTLPLTGDESYHWEWSRNLALGYYDHPGLTAYLIFIFTSLFGKSTELTVRFAAVVMLAGTAIVSFLFARRIVLDRGDTEQSAEKAGLMAGVLIMIVPVYAFLSCYMSTDPPIIFFWSLSMYLLYLAFTKEKWMYWIIAGAAFGLTLQSKFLSFFMVGSAGLFVLISPKDRKWLSRPQAYVAFACALLIFSPLLWWNSKNEWATFMFNFVYRQKQHAFSFEHVPVSIASQMLALSPLIFPFAVFAIYRSIRDWIEKKDRAMLYLGMCSLVPIGYFVYLSFRWQVDPHWPAAGWLGAMIYLACYWTDSRRKAETKTFRRLRASALIVSLIMVVMVYVAVHIPPKLVADINWVYSRNSDIDIKQHGERFGWREMGEWVSGVRKEMLEKQGDEGKGVFVISDKYGLVGNISFYTPDQIRAHLWSRQKTHGENYRYWDDFPSMKGQDAVLVLKKESRVDSSRNILKYYFEKVDQMERLPIIIDGLNVRDFFIIRAYNYNGVIPEFMKKKKH